MSYQIEQEIRRIAIEIANNSPRLQILECRVNEIQMRMTPEPVNPLLAMIREHAVK